MKHNDLLKLRESVAIAKRELAKATIDADIPCPSDDLYYAMQAEDADELVGVRIKQLNSALSLLMRDIEAVMPYPVKRWAPDNVQSERGYDVTQLDADGNELMCQFFDNYFKANDFAQEVLSDGYCEAVRIEAVEKRLQCVWRLSEQDV